MTFASTFKPDACCARPAVANMDHLRPPWPGDRDAEPERMVNRCCTHCWTHWYGQEGAVRRYSRQEWDAWAAEEGLA